ncbi:hypothetical protein M3Y94_00047800 [Aphelenchoides besseyi]|nr:hypothetical protein M3Y94_00047800 [Aphelenchoides besseyi]KAI6217020.1 hypothetical protein M3Y95_01246200 [Aphelenchoides besseyi]
MSTFSTHNNEFCVCGIHVHSGSFISGVVIIILNCLNAFSAVKKMLVAESKSYYTPYSGAGDFSVPTLFFSLVFTTISTICAITMLYGNRTLQPRLYRPHLIVELIAFVIVMVSGFLVAIGGLLTMTTRFDRYGLGENAGVSLLSFSLIILAIGLVRYYFSYVVVKRSQRLLTHQIDSYITGTLGMKEIY